MTLAKTPSKQSTLRTIFEEQFEDERVQWKLEDSSRVLERCNECWKTKGLIEPFYGLTTKLESGEGEGLYTQQNYNGELPPLSYPAYIVNTTLRRTSNNERKPDVRIMVRDSVYKKRFGESMASIRHPSWWVISHLSSWSANHDCSAAANATPACSERTFLAV